MFVVFVMFFEMHEDEPGNAVDEESESVAI